MATADSSPSSDNPTLINGDLTYIYLGEHGGGEIHEIFLNFDLSAIPAYARINSAILSLFQYNSSYDWQNVTISVACEMCGAPWAEMSINWNNKPTNASGTPSKPINVRSVSDGVNGTNEYRWDVKEHIAAVANCSIAWNGFRLRYTGTASETAKYFRSREYGTANQRPKLAINYDLPFGKIAAVEGQINKVITGMKIASVQGPINKTVVGMKIVTTPGGAFKTVF